MTFIHNSAVTGTTYFLCSVGYLLMAAVLIGERKWGSHRSGDWGLFGLLSIYGLVRGTYHFAELFFLLAFQRLSAFTVGGWHEVVWVAGDYLTVIALLAYSWRLLRFHRPLGFNLRWVGLGLLAFWVWILTQAVALGYDLRTAEAWSDLKPFLICLPTFSIVSYCFWQLAGEYQKLRLPRRSRSFRWLAWAFIAQTASIMVLASLNVASKHARLNLDLTAAMDAMGFVRAGLLFATVYVLYRTLTAGDEEAHTSLMLNETGLAIASQVSASVVNLVCHVMRAEGAVVLMFQYSGGRRSVRCLAVQGLPPGLIAYLTGDTVNLDRLRVELEARYGAVYWVPVKGESCKRGELVVVRSQHATLTAEDRRLLESLGGQVSSTLAGITDLVDAVEARAIQDERLRISREMHDGLSPLLAYLRIKVESAKLLLDEREDQPVSVTLGEIDKVVAEALADVRESITGLRSTMDGENIAEKLCRYLGSFEARTGVRVIYDPGSVPPGLSAKVESQVLRIVQEALTNVRKHAQATEVQLGLETAGTRLVVTVRDNGQGFVVRNVGEGRYGLSTMRERSAEIGGILEITSSPGAGTTIRLTVPMQLEEEERLGAPDKGASRGRSRTVSGGLGQPDFV